MDRRLRLIRGSEQFAEAIVERLDNLTIEVRISDAHLWHRQVLGIALVDLLGRLFPRLVFTGVDTAAHPHLPPGPADLRLRLHEAHSHGIGPQEPGEPALVIGIGSGVADFFCDAAGWQSYLGPTPSELPADGSADVPVGAVAAACRAAARAFAVAMQPFGQVPPALEVVYSSALTYETAGRPMASPELAPPRLILAGLMGAGSIGGAAAYVWARVPDLAGALDVIDYQALEPHNPDRALLATRAAAEARLAKVKVASDALAHHSGLVVRAHQQTLAAWVANRQREDALPLVLCAFDSVEARRELQDSLPLEVINAACGAERVVVSGHRTGDGPCLYCLYVGDVLDTENITFKLIVAATGLPDRTVQGLLEHHVPLTVAHIEQIERRGGLARGALARYVGHELIELYQAELRYGEAALGRGDDRAAVALPFVTALAGTLLAGEALKAGDAEYQDYRLGPFVPSRTRYEEDLFVSAATALVTPVARWEGSECLCRSTRRQRLLVERYGLAG